MSRLEEVKREEYELLETQSIPLRNYLMKHVMPTLTQGLIDACKTRPDDAIDYLVSLRFLWKLVFCNNYLFPCHLPKLVSSLLLNPVACTCRTNCSYREWPCLANIIFDTISIPPVPLVQLCKLFHPFLIGIFQAEYLFQHNPQVDWDFWKAMYWTIRSILFARILRMISSTDAVINYGVVLLGLMISKYWVIKYWPCPSVSDNEHTIYIYIQNR